MSFIIEADSPEELATACQEFLSAIGNGTGAAVKAARKGNRKGADAAAAAGAAIDPSTVPQPLAPPGTPLGAAPAGFATPNGAGFAPPVQAAPQGVIAPPDFSSQLTQPPPAFVPPAQQLENPEITRCKQLLDAAIAKHGQTAIYDNYIVKNMGIPPGTPVDAFKASILTQMPAHVLAQLNAALAAA